MPKYNKWNKYKIGEADHINKTRHYPHREMFVDWVVNSSISSVIEVGPGELIEYQVIKEKKSVKYYSNGEKLKNDFTCGELVNKDFINNKINKISCGDVGC